MRKDETDVHRQHYNHYVASHADCKERLVDFWIMEQLVKEVGVVQADEC